MVFENSKMRQVPCEDCSEPYVIRGEPFIAECDSERPWSPIVSIDDAWYVCAGNRLRRFDSPIDLVNGNISKAVDQGVCTGCEILCAVPSRRNTFLIGSQSSLQVWCEGNVKILQSGHAIDMTSTASFAYIATEQGLFVFSESRLTQIARLPIVTISASHVSENVFIAARTGLFIFIETSKIIAEIEFDHVGEEVHAVLPIGDEEFAVLLVGDAGTRLLFGFICENRFHSREVAVNEVFARGFDGRGFLRWVPEAGMLFAGHSTSDQVAVFKRKSDGFVALALPEGRQLGCLLPTEGTGFTYVRGIFALLLRNQPLFRDNQAFRLAIVVPQADGRISVHLLKVPDDYWRSASPMMRPARDLFKAANHGIQASTTSVFGAIGGGVREPAMSSSFGLPASSSGVFVPGALSGSVPAVAGTGLGFINAENHSVFHNFGATVSSESAPVAGPTIASGSLFHGSSAPPGPRALAFGTIAEGGHKGAITSKASESDRSPFCEAPAPSSLGGLFGSGARTVAVATGSLFGSFGATNAPSSAAGMFSEPMSVAIRSATGGFGAFSEATQIPAAASAFQSGNLFGAASSTAVVNAVVAPGSPSTGGIFGAPTSTAQASVFTNTPSSSGLASLIVPKKPAMPPAFDHSLAPPKFAGVLKTVPKAEALTPKVEPTKTPTSVGFVPDMSAEDESMKQMETAIPVAQGSLAPATGSKSAGIKSPKIPVAPTSVADIVAHWRAENRKDRIAGDEELLDLIETVEKELAALEKLKSVGEVRFESGKETSVCQQTLDSHIQACSLKDLEMFSSECDSLSSTIRTEFFGGGANDAVVTDIELRAATLDNKITDIFMELKSILDFFRPS